MRIGQTDCTGRWIKTGRGTWRRKSMSEEAQHVNYWLRSDGAGKQQAGPGAPSPALLAARQALGLAS